MFNQHPFKNHKSSHHFAMHRLHIRSCIQFTMASSSSSSNSGGDQGSSNPNPDPSSPPQQQFHGERIPWRRGGGVNLGASPLRLAGVSSPPRAVRPLAMVPPVMGVRGVSAFSRYNRPTLRPSSPTTASGTVPPGAAGFSAFAPYNRPPPRPDWHSCARSSSGSSGFGFGFGFGPGLGLFGPHVVPVGGSGPGGLRGAGLGVGGSPVARKRVREDGNAGGPAAAAGRQQRDGGGNLVACPICGRGFMSEKALFGHMRSHPNRGWKGVHPPPAFRAEVEFADVPGLNRPAGMAAAGGEEVAAAPEAEGRGDAEMQTQGGAEEKYNVPDLNMPPPPSPDQ